MVMVAIDEQTILNNNILSCAEAKMYSIVAVITITIKIQWVMYYPCIHLYPNRQHKLLRIQTCHVSQYRQCLLFQFQSATQIDKLQGNCNIHNGGLFQQYSIIHQLCLLIKICEWHHKENQ